MGVIGFGFLSLLCFDGYLLLPKPDKQMIPANLFNDKRLERKSNELITRLSEKRSCVINQVSQNWAEQISFYRFLNNERVSECSLQAQIQAKCKSRIPAESQILIISDTSDFDYSFARKHIKDESGLGYIGNHKGWGYYLHASLAVNPQDRSILGMSDAYLWHRSEEKSNFRQSPYHTALSEKESYRWIEACLRSKPIGEAAKEVTFIHDSEGDIYDSFLFVPGPGEHLLVRSKHNRRIRTPEGQKSKLYPYLSSQPCACVYQFEVEANPRNNRTAHTATMELRYSSVWIEKAAKVCYKYQKDYPQSIEVQAIEVRQQAQSVPEGEDPIHWILLTTHQIKDFTDAITLVYWYSLRWIIEDFFRLLKRKGFHLEGSELETGYGLRKLGLVTMQSAIQIMQLREARDGESQIPLEEVFSEDEIESLEKIGPTLEGKTEKLKNPYQPNTLPWASWIIARIGGWKGYKSQNPPGVITYTRGCDRFQDIHRGIQLRI
ncbi:MAG: IS4 family transposase [Bacteroidota bacterium]